MSDLRDLTQMSVTFPDLPEPLTPRNTLVRWLHDRFSPERKVIVVQGPDGAGNTTLLAQFAKTYPERCFTFFLKEDYWTSTPIVFLQELCSQMQEAIRDERTDVENDYYDLKDRFARLYRQVAKRARRLGSPFYFVIDGLEWLPEDTGSESIMDLLPYEPLDGIFFLASCATWRELEFTHHAEPIKFFSQSDTADYLRRIGITDKEKIQLIYEACGGMPGYLDQIRREIESEVPLKEILTSLPRSFQKLLEREWERIDVKEEATLKALAILAYSQSSLHSVDLSEMVGTEANNLQTRLASLPPVQLRKDGKQVGFVTDAHRRFIANEMNKWKSWAYAALIKYHKQKPLSENSQNQLPILYRKTDNFNELTSYVNVAYLADMLRESHNVFLLRRNVRFVAHEAYDQEEWQILSTYALIDSILRMLSTRSAAESEVEALLALGEYQKSYEIASQAVLAADQLQLLARIASHMRQQGNTIPNEVLSDLERMVSEIDPHIGLRERLVEVAADLFYAHPQAAKNLVERIAGVDTSGRLMDMLLAVLAMKLEGEAGRSVEALRSRISDQSLRNFARANSSIVADFTVQEVLTEAEELQDTSSKLFLLRSWCNANRRNPEASRVIKTALRIMTASTDYSPSMRHLRQFAEPLLASEVSEAYQIVDTFDFLKDTAIEKPAEEAVRLELVLASVEAKRSKEVANQRLLDTFLSLEKISELDIRCYCLARVLLSLPKIDAEDPLQIQMEVNEKLPNKYEELIKNSAYHWVLTRRLLGSLTNHKPEIAIEFASRLNSAERRDKAYREILRVYTDRVPDSIDLSLVESVLGRISEKPRRDLALVRVLEHFAERDLFGEVPEARQSIINGFIDRIREIRSPIGQSLAYARSLQMMASAGKTKQAEEIFNQMVDAWSNIDKLWQQVHFGFDLAAIIAEDAPELAQIMFNMTKKARATTPLGGEPFIELYINTINLAIRIFPDIAKDQDYTSQRERLIKAIECIPSCAIQAQLLAHLGLRHHFAGKTQDFQNIVKEKVIPILETCEDEDLYAKTIIEIAPCLFKYERELMKDEVSKLSPSQQDKALGRVVTCLLSGRPSTDPIDLDSLNVELEYVTALQVCRVIEQMNSDSSIYSYLSTLVDKLLKPTVSDSQSEKCVLIEKQAIKIARELRKIIDDRFPDPTGIRHEGYKIAAYASLSRLRGGAQQRSPYRADKRWPELAPNWETIAQNAREVPNAADRTLVLAWVGAEMYSSETNLAHELLEEARNCIDDIPNILDRSARLEALARSWKKIGDEESAKHLIGEGMSILKAWSWDQTRDQVTGKFLELAHSLDPEFAASLTSTVDNPLIRHDLEQDLASRKIQHQPSTIGDQKLDTENLQPLLGQSAYRLLRSFCSGRGKPQQRKVIGQWIQAIVGAQFEEAYKVTAWYIENELAQTKALGAPRLRNAYGGLLDSLNMILRTGDILLGAEKTTNNLSRGNSAVRTSLRLFSSGSGDQAIEVLEEWLRENTEEYVKIYDPYFNLAELDVLKGIPSDIRVYILTSWKAQAGIKFGDATLAQHYKQSWDRISDLAPPETHIYVIGIKSTGESPMHDRYYITANAGIELGTSRSGLGKKDSYLRLLSIGAAARIESEYIDSLIVTPPSRFKNEKLEVLTFTL